ncbi:hypothetical protein LINGRAHAP2_LOCUS3469, partial [Linum grandiflorum]
MMGKAHGPGGRGGLGELLPRVKRKRREIMLTAAKMRIAGDMVDGGGWVCGCE